MARFCDKKGMAINENRWRELHQDYDYVHLAEHETENVLVQALWHGRVDPKAHEMFWEPFSVMVWERGVNGNWLEEPEIMNYADEQDALFSFVHKVLKRCPKCYLKDGELVQVDNLAAERIAAEKLEAAERKAAAEAEREEAVRLKLEKLAAIEAEKERVRKEKEREEKLAKELEELAEMAEKGDDYGSWS